MPIPVSIAKWKVVIVNAISGTIESCRRVKNDNCEMRFGYEKTVGENRSQLQIGTLTILVVTICIPFHSNL